MGIARLCAAGADVDKGRVPAAAEDGCACRKAEIARRRLGQAADELRGGDELRQMRLVLNIDGRAFAEATVGEMDRAMGNMARRAVAR